MSDENKAALEALDLVSKSKRNSWAHVDALATIRAALTRPEPRVVEVDTHCVSCPMGHNAGQNVRCAVANKDIPWDGQLPPDWCPLRAGDVLLRLRGGK